MNLNVTETALEELANLAANREKMKPLRIYVAAYGWGGPTFGLTLDEQKDGDIETKLSDFTFLLEDGLAEAYSSFTIDYNDSGMKRGFTVTQKGASGGC